MYNYKIVDKNTDEVVATGTAKTTLEIIKKYDLAGISQQHLKVVIL